MFQHGSGFTGLFFCFCFIVLQNKENHKRKSILKYIGEYTREMVQENGELFNRAKMQPDEFLDLGLVQASVLLS